MGIEETGFIVGNRDGYGVIEGNRGEYEGKAVIEETNGVKE